MPSFPSDVMFFMIGFMAIALALSIIFFKDTFLVRGMLAIAVMWLNLFKWSFGGLGHQAHLLVLAHLLGIFILSKDIPANRANRQISKSIEWFYLGLLATYTYAGFWKLLALIYKLVLKPNEINWLSPEGALYTSIIGYFGSDMRIDQVAGLFTFPIFWQVSFLLTCFILSFSFLAAFREPLRIWIALAIITFHLINNIVFNVEFYTPLWVLLVLFFPYQRILSKDFIFISPTIDKKFSGKGNNAFYERSYENGEKDKFYNFYAYREMIYDKKKWWRGLLYFPFIDLTAMAFWKMKYALHKPLKS